MGDPSFGDVLAELRALRSEVEDLRPLRDEVHDLRQRVGVSPTGSPPGPVAIVEDLVPGASTDPNAPASPAPASGPMDRRAALRAGLLAAGVAVVAVAADASPAAAANGSPITLGSQANTATGATITAVSAPEATVGFGVWDVSRAALTPSTYPAIGGHAKGSSFNVGVEGLGEGFNTGVEGTSTDGYGVVGHAVGHVGVAGTGITGVDGKGTAVGVSGSATNGTGVYATSSNGSGLLAVGVRNHIKLPAVVPSRVAPTADAFFHDVGDLVVDGAGILWFCIVSGTPGQWRRLVGTATAGAFHVLPAPARVYDSRPGTNPSQGPKTKLSTTARTLDCTVNNSGVPIGATAVALTVLLVDALNGSSNMTIWANGAPKPASNTMVWGAGSGRYTSFTISAVDAAAKIQVYGGSTNLVLDVVGYYR
jgi:hypothetical protein